jgi:membrane-bound lytic murein transglycosylase B
MGAGFRAVSLLAVLAAALSCPGAAQTPGTPPAQQPVAGSLAIPGAVPAQTPAAGAPRATPAQIPGTLPVQAPPVTAPSTAPATIIDQGAQFRAFVAGFRTTAIQAGIDPTIYDASMTGVVRNPRVEQLNLQQPEFVKPIWDYLDSAVSLTRITRGQTMLAAYAPTLAWIEQRFGVQKEILVAIWGMESNYGASMGSFNMFEALATLGYAGPRSDFGRRELLNALRMEQQEHFSPIQMTSSWAGAFGQTQFIPSAFLK